MTRDGWRFARCLLSLTVGLGAAPLLHAQARDAQRVVLRIASDADRQLLPRLRGQLSDVDATLIVAETAPLEAELESQLEVARALATLHRADVIVWCARAADVTQQRLVHIALPRADRLLTRQLSGATHNVLSSSELETAAVLIRSALMAKAQGVELGEPVHNVAPEPAAPGPPTNSENAATPADSTRPSPPSFTVPSGTVQSQAAAEPMAGDVPAASRVEASAAISSPALASRADEAVDDRERWPRQARDRAEPSPPDHPGHTPATLRARLSFGAQLALDGQSSSGQRGLYARAGLSSGAWAVYASGVLSLASDLEDPNFALRVARHAVAVMLERQLPLSETLWLGLAVQGGALLLRRTSQAERAFAVSYPASLTAAFVLGPELACTWMPGRFGLSVRLGLDYLPNAPRFETAGLTPERSRVSHALWSVEPRIALGLETALP